MEYSRNIKYIVKRIWHFGYFGGKESKMVQNDFMYLKNLYLLDTVTVGLTWYFHKEKEKSGSNELFEKYNMKEKDETPQNPWLFWTDDAGFLTLEGCMYTGVQAWIPICTWREENSFHGEDIVQLRYVVAPRKLIKLGETVALLTFIQQVSDMVQILHCCDWIFFNPSWHRLWYYIK